MCLSYRNPRSRASLFVANLSLVIGLLLWNFREYIPMNANLLHAVTGFLLGLSITMNLYALIRARRSRAGSPDAP